MRSIPESDWKILRGLKDELLAVACEAVFKRVEHISSARKGQEHASYLKLWQLINDDNDDIALMFDNLRRSSALQQIMAMRSRGVMTDKQVALFSQETQDLTALYKRF